MKKSILNDIIFVPASKTIDTGIDGFDVRNLYAIINQTAKEVIYATGTTGKGFDAVSGSVITLQADTTAMNAADVLQVIYDDSGDIEIAEALYTIAQQLSFLTGVKGVLADLRVTPTGTVTISGNLTTVSTVSNQTNIGGYNAAQQIPAQQNTVSVLSNINNIIQS